MTELSPAERFGGVRYSSEGEILICKYGVGCRREGAVWGTLLRSIVGEKLGWDDILGCEKGAESKRRKERMGLDDLAGCVEGVSYIGDLPGLNDVGGSELTPFMSLFGFTEGDKLSMDACVGYAGVTILLSFIGTIVGDLLGVYNG